MADTTNKEAALWTASQNQPDVTVNSGLSTLDDSIAGVFTHDMTSDANYSLLAAEWKYKVIVITDTNPFLGAARDIVLPNDNPGIYYFYNNTSTHALSLLSATGTGIPVAATKRAILQCDGTNVVRWTADI